uniref:Uncharacterized protein n=1 Tax=viral metagenome TaxID=1070528 RepID=A0A6C0CPI5_9ZZZZ
MTSSFNERSKEFLLLRSLISFYHDPLNFRILLFFLHGSRKRLSLRLLDWLVTNYAKKHGVVFKPKDSENIEFMYLQYKNQLKSYSKKFFDSFARRQRVFYKYSHEVFNISYHDIAIYAQRQDGFVTTLAQLNAFRWFISSGIIDFAITNLDDIEKDMIIKNEHSKKEMLSQHSKENDIEEYYNVIKTDVAASLHDNIPQYSKITGFNTVIMYKFHVTVQFSNKLET